jgi:hypothetical protein
VDGHRLGHFWKGVSNIDKVVAELKWLSKTSLGDE